MEGMADHPPLVPELRDRLDGRAIHIEHPNAIGHLLNSRSRLGHQPAFSAPERASATVCGESATCCPTR
jgi:hypothetical protein